MSDVVERAELVTWAQAFIDGKVTGDDTAHMVLLDDVCRGFIAQAAHIAALEAENARLRSDFREAVEWAKTFASHAAAKFSAALAEPEGGT